VLDPQWSETIRHELGWLADSTNTRRDLDVLRGRLTGYRDVLDSADLPSLVQIVQACDDEAEVARSQILEVLKSERYLNLLSELVATVQTRARCDLETQQENVAQEHQGERKQLISAVGHRWKQLEKQIGYLQIEPTAAGLHQTRIKAKRCRAAVEAVAPSVGSDAKKFARSLAELQDVLGDIHDCEVAQAWCRRLAQEQPSVALVAGQLVADTRRDQAQLVQKWPAVWRHSKKLHRRMKKAKALRSI
jgi:CHAD domain-containing protein